MSLQYIGLSHHNYKTGYKNCPHTLTSTSRIFVLEYTGSPGSAIVRLFSHIIYISHIYVFV